MKKALIALAIIIVVIVGCCLIVFYRGGASVTKTTTIASSSTTSSTSTSTGLGKGVSHTVSRISGYVIKVYLNGKLVRSLTLRDLHKLKNYEFVDSLGHLQEGPLLADVLKYALGNSSCKYVVIKGMRGAHEAKLPCSIINNLGNYVILDYTGRGTVKLCAKENVLPRDKWVKDVTAIMVYTRG